MSKHYGLRLDEERADPARSGDGSVAREPERARAMSISRGVMRLNRFLGDLVGCPAVLGEWSYTFCLFGTPSTIRAVGLAAVRPPSQPELLCARPADGADASLPRRRAGLRGYRTVRRHEPVRGRRARRPRAHALVVARQQQQAIVAHSMVGGDLPPGRRHFADNLHLGGAHQDNRIMPYEGLRGIGALRARSAAICSIWSRLYRAAAAGTARSTDGGDRAASRRHAFLLDRRLRRDQSVLLSDPEPGRASSSSIITPACS